MDPVSIFPPEVWKEIMDRLPTHKEKLSAYNTCSLWRSFLEEKRTLWMFQGIFPFLFKYLPAPDLLKTRLICKCWNGVIESYLEKGQIFVLSPGRHHANTRRVMPFRTLEVDFDKSGYRRGLTTKQALQLFRKQFFTGDGGTQCTKNPIVSRSICLTLNTVDFEVLNFLEMFGVHVHSLKLQLIQKPPYEISSPEQTVKFIWNVLSLVPNLRKLALCSIIKNVCAIAQSEEVRIVQVQKVQIFLENNLVPSLPHLSDLHIITDIVDMRTFLEALYCPQLTKYVHTAGQNFMPTNLANLTDMAWVFLDSGAFTELERFSKLNSPFLLRLHIYVEKFPDVCILFRKIECYNGSLTYLSLYWTYFEGPLPKDLNLPFLQEFSLEIKSCEDPENINFFFLQMLKSLRKLTCTIWDLCYSKLKNLYEQSDSETFYSMSEDIDLHQCLTEHGAFESNIWRLLPALDVFKFQIVDRFFSSTKTDTTIYTRAGWENYTKKFKNV